MKHPLRQQTASAPRPRTKPVAHLHLNHGRSPDEWILKFEAGLVWEEYPYGYNQAAPWIEISHSVDQRETRAIRLVRRGIAYFLGFDILHAFRNRVGIRAADVVWTHTEKEHLAVSLLIKLRIIPAIPVIGQSVWLWDDWSHFSRVRQLFYRWLLKEIAVHTVHSSRNRLIASDVLQGEVLLVPFGLSAEVSPLSPPRGGGVIEVLAIGNDRDRDWGVLANATEGSRGWRTTVLSKRRSARRLRQHFAHCAPARTLSEIQVALARCNVVAIPLHENHHASGLTATFEALMCARAAVVSDTGGLRDYFTDAVEYAHVGDAQDFALAVERASRRSSDDLNNQRRVVQDRGLTGRDYARRHVLITYALLTGSQFVREISAFEAVPEHFVDELFRA